jgi:phosphoribosyl-ATP pyrophosphohydrolase/phosphoribosyl-AMP cyclohydrolase/histidinol dehydrogenase
MTILKRRTIRELVAASAAPMRQEILTAAAAIIRDVRERGEVAVREHAARFDGLASSTPLVMDRDDLASALRSLPPTVRERLTRIAARIRAFADGQRQSLQAFETEVPGGRAGHTIAPVRRAGCYAPGGRYPLPSSILMTAITARAAGVEEVWVSCSRRDPVMFACAALAEADGFLSVGGAQAIAALAYGAGAVPPCDLIVGPGNAYASAAKRLVFGDVGIDAIAGPSELVVVADQSADASLIAADLLAQAEHDPMAIPVLVSLSEKIVNDVDAELTSQLEFLPTADVARLSLANGGAVVVRDMIEAIACCDELAPEHLHLQLASAWELVPHFSHYGALFVGSDSAEVLGDYGAGPNHVLPTGRASRFSGGLSVFSFLRVRTWLRVDDVAESGDVLEDTAWLARVEGLEAHARAAELRLTSRQASVT